MLWKEHALRKAVTKEISPFLHEQEKNNVAAFLQDKQPIEKAILSTTK